MEKLKLIPQTKFDNKVKNPKMIQYLNADYIEKVLNSLIKSMYFLSFYKFCLKKANSEPLDSLRIMDFSSCKFSILMKQTGGGFFFKI